MALDFDAIKRKLDRLSGNNTNRNTMWKPEEGNKYTIRLLSFPDNEQKNISNECIGELMICQKVLEKEAFDQEKKIFDHFIHLVIHSMLHILGYAHEDKNDAILMESKEIEFLSKIGVKDPYK